MSNKKVSYNVFCIDKKGPRVETREGHRVEVEGISFFVSGRGGYTFTHPATGGTWFRVYAKNRPDAIEACRVFTREKKRSGIIHRVLDHAKGRIKDAGIPYPVNSGEFSEEYGV